MKNSTRKSSPFKIAQVLSILGLIVCGLIIWGLTIAYYGMSVSPDGKTLVVTTHTRITMYRISDGKVLHQERGKPYGYQPYQGEFSNIAWSPDGKNLAIGKLNNGIWIWDTQTWEVLSEKDSEIDVHNEPGFAWSPDGQQLVLGRGDGIWMWDKRENQWEFKSSAEYNLLSVNWTENKLPIALIGSEIHDLENGFLSDLDHHIDGLGKASWSLDGSHVFIFFDLGGSVMNVSENVYEFGAGIFPEFAWSKDGRYFASVEEGSNEFYVWDTTNDVIVRQEQQGNVIYSLAWTPEGDLLALGMRNWQTMIWNTNTGETVLTMFVPPNVFRLID